MTSNADLQAEVSRLRAALDYIGTYASESHEIYPVGSTDIVYSADGEKIVEYIGPWVFLDGTGDTFLEAIEDSMRKARDE